VVIALIVTPEGFPLAYEVMAGNTSDKTTLREFLKKIEQQYGKADRIWVMDRGIPTKEVLAEMRAADPPIHYLVGTPRGLLSKYEEKLLRLPWQVVREGVSVKLLAEDKELYVFAQSQDRVSKERAMRRRQLKGLCKRLKQLQQMDLKRDELLKKLGAALRDFPTAARLMETTVAPKAAQLSFSLRKDKLRQARKREGRYLLRSNIVSGRSPEELWHFYIQLTQVEGAFKDLKDDLNLRPIRHQLEGRIEAHIFISFLAYCLHVTLRRRLRDLAPGLTARAVLEKFATIQMLDVHLPTTDQRTVVMRRYTQPESDVQLLLQRLKLELPPQPPPKIMNPKPPGQTGPVVKT
jgi:transposase